MLRIYATRGVISSHESLAERVLFGHRCTAAQAVLVSQHTISESIRAETRDC